MRKYHFTAELVEPVYLDVEAENLEEAKKEARECAEAGAWNTFDGMSGSFNINWDWIPSEEITKKEK